ncbi:IniB N-terminal domain-containing protein [Amycolatopsis sp. NPDC058278]|uniref:IniB N-terminal domain-containing protein n=1 Tax=Amycolatopsis sp. NPDC058278 TaxID=3346417 RepID=UPI0036DC6567
MDSVQTLHDFALNLLNDPTALAAFGTDPQGVLAAAGLGDVSAADVHEVIPLVLDYVPVDSLPAVGGLPVVGDLSPVGTDAPGVQGAIDQLTALTAGLGLPATSGLPGVGDLGVGELPVVGELPAVGSLGSLPGVNVVTNAANVTALAGNATGAILGGDLAHGLDSQALANLTAAPAYLTEPESGVTGNVAYAAAAGVGEAQQVLATSNAEIHEVNGHVGDVAGTLGDVTGALGAGNAVSGLTSHVGDFSGILKGAGDVDVKHVTGDVAGAVHGLGDVTNTVTSATGINVDHNVVGQVGELASGNGTAVHDVVSDVADVSHNALGNLHLGDIASGNDIHLGH